MLRHLKKWFYGGPKDLGLRLKGRSGYQSPTVTAIAWCLALAVRHFSVAGRLTALCCLLLVPYSLVTTTMPVYILSFAVITLFAVDFLWGWLARPQLELARSFPRRVAAGAELAVSYRLRNRRRWRAWSLQVDSLPFPQTVEVVQAPASVATLPSGGEATLSARWLAKRRGEQTIPALRCVSGFPFGLFSWGLSVGAAERLLVYPRFTPLDRVALTIGETYQPEGGSMSGKAGLSMEFLGCREFRDGDDLRRLHMRSWARCGFPVVKEFRQEYMARTGIVMDTYLPRRLFEDVRMRFAARKEFEGAVSLAAALVDYFAKNDSRVDLFAAGDAVHHFGGSHGVDYIDRVLDILAELSYSTTDDFAALGEKISLYTLLTSGMVFILGRWDESRRRVVEQVSSSGVECLVVLVSETAREGEFGDLPAWVRRVSSADILQGRCKNL